MLHNKILDAAKAVLSGHRQCYIKPRVGQVPAKTLWSPASDWPYLENTDRRPQPTHSIHRMEVSGWSPGVLGREGHVWGFTVPSKTPSMSPWPMGYSWGHHASFLFKIFLEVSRRPVLPEECQGGIQGDKELVKTMCRQNLGLLKKKGQTWPPFLGDELLEAKISHVGNQ